MPENGTTNLELLVSDPDTVAEKIADSLGKLRHRDGSGEMVYSPFGEHSYYHDFLSAQTGKIESPGAADRLVRHAEQMRHVQAERQRAAEQRSRSFQFEQRVTPDRADGTGGYFSPPAWLDQLFATANRPGRVLSGLMPRFPLPAGVSSVSLPIINTGTSTGATTDDSAAADQDLTDQATTSAAVPIVGQADIALQLLEQSPAAAAADWAIFTDLSQGYDATLESQLIAGTGGSNMATAQLLGVTNVTGITTVAYTNATPTGTGMWPLLSQVPAQIGNKRRVPAECWLMRSARWFWLQGSEDATSQRPFGLSTRFFLGSDDGTPDPIGGLMGLPVFGVEAIPANLGAGTNQDMIIALRPRDTILLEGDSQTMVARDVLSSTLGVRLQMRRYTAAFTARHPAGIGVLSGTGLVLPAGWA